MIVTWANGEVALVTIKKIIMKSGRIWPGCAAWKPVGDGVTTCIYCGKPLTDMVSFARGVGPECIKKYGPWPERAWIEQHVKAFKKFVRKAEKEGKPITKMLQWMKDTGIPIPTTT